MVIGAFLSWAAFTGQQTVQPACPLPPIMVQPARRGLEAL